MIQLMSMLSIVVPFLNEEESLRDFYNELTKEVSKNNKSYEIIFVDDGSTDSSLEIAKDLAKKDKRIRIFSLRKHHGKSEALTVGFQRARGESVVTLDADLQDKPSEIKKLQDKAAEGYDVVCGWRKNRKDTTMKKISSKLFNSLTRMFWGLRLHDYNCGLKYYTEEAAKSLNIYGGLHRFIPLLVYQDGFSVTEVPIIHEKRRFGKSKYGLSKILKDLPDIFTMLFLSKYSKKPLHFFGVFGFVFLSLGLGILFYLAFMKLFLGVGIGSRPLLFLGVLSVLSGLQIFFTGFLADIMINVSTKESAHYPIKYSSE